MYLCFTFSALFFSSFYLKWLQLASQFCEPLVISHVSFLVALLSLFFPAASLLPVSINSHWCSCESHQHESLFWDESNGNQVRRRKRKKGEERERKKRETVSAGKNKVICVFAHPLQIPSSFLFFFSFFLFIYLYTCKCIGREFR